MINKEYLAIPLALLLNCVVVGKAGAWAGFLTLDKKMDVHFLDTFELAITVGFSVSAAWILAWADDEMDRDQAYFLDKTWHLDRSFETGDTMDTRLKHAVEEMNAAKAAIGNRLNTEQQMETALKHLGHGLHALQDFYAHMNAGVGKEIGNPFSHGMVGVEVKGLGLDGEKRMYPVEELYDNVLWDYTNTEGWHEHRTKQENSRWLSTRDRTIAYLYEFLLYVYRHF